MNALEARRGWAITEAMRNITDREDTVVASATHYLYRGMPIGAKDVAMAALLDLDPYTLAVANLPLNHGQ